LGGKPTDGRIIKIGPEKREYLGAINVDGRNKKWP
jgi:hypothetical protein